MKLFNEISKSEFEVIVRNASCIADVLRYMEYSSCKTSYKSFYILASRYNISYSHFSLGLHNRRGKISNAKLTKDEFAKKYLVEGSLRKVTLSKLVTLGFFENKCQGNGCRVSGVWLDGTIVLQVDHINGINSDNRITNLRLLCPNCHSQTSTFSGKNRLIRKSLPKCIDCDATLSSHGSTRCMSCSGKRVNSEKKKFEVSKDKLAILIKTHTYTDLGRMFGVSDNAIRKRAKGYGLIV